MRELSDVANGASARPREGTSGAARGARVDEHRYELLVEWTGNRGRGTASYHSYERDHSVRAAGKPLLLASSDPHFRGDASRYNPEELLVAALSGCHMLWYLHLCASHGVEVVSYADRAEGRMVAHAEGGHFVEVVLHPRVQVRDAAMIDTGIALHRSASRACFISSSVNFPVRHRPAVSSIDPSGDRAAR